MVHSLAGGSEARYMNGRSKMFVVWNRIGRGSARLDRLFETEPPIAPLSHLRKDRTAKAGDQTPRVGRLGPIDNRLRLSLHVFDIGVPPTSVIIQKVTKRIIISFLTGPCSQLLL